MSTAIFPIFWPDDIHHSGFVYGWTRPVLCAAGVLETDSKENAQARLELASSTTDWLSHGHDPTVLGRCLFTTISAPPKLELDSSCYDISSHHASEPLLVYYRRPKVPSMRFYSLDPSVFEFIQIQHAAQTPMSSAHAARNIEMSLVHDFTRPSTGHSALQPATIHQLNASYVLETLLENPSPPPSPGRIARSWKTLSPYRLGPLPKLPTSVLGEIWAFLVDVSATVEQIDVRAKQAVDLFGRFPDVSRTRMPSAHSSSQYVRFYNCIWLILNDVIVGAAFGAFVNENRMLICHLLDEHLHDLLVDTIQRALLWLDSWPAGLKLNTELSAFYCHIFLGVVTLWGRVLTAASPGFPFIVDVVAGVGYAGTTMTVSLLSDLLGLFTVHLYLCYALAAMMHSYQLSTARSLWNLFRGKRYNVLRNRTDSWDYEIDQLLLGTILFTLLAFLAPTVLTYYLLFAMVRLVVIAVHAGFDTVLALMNHFPLFALLLLVKDPARLPGGATLEVDPKGEFITFKNKPASLSHIFMHYAYLGRHISTHYNPLRLLRCICTGARLIPIPRSQIRYGSASGINSNGLVAHT